MVMVLGLPRRQSHDRAGGEADVEADAEQRGGRAASRFWLAAVLPLAMEPRNLGPRIVAVTVRVSTPPVRAPGRDRQDNERP